MRLFPPAWYLTRRAEKDVEVGGYRVPKGTTMVMNVWGLHHDPRFYPDPEAFRPERWSEDFISRLPKFAYIPFGAGPRLCIGSTFAWTEVMLVLASVIQRFQVKAQPGATVRPVAATTVRPSEDGVRVILQERSQPGRNRSESRPRGIPVRSLQLVRRETLIGSETR
jgi:cytochrome P450